MLVKIKINITLIRTIKKVGRKSF